MQHPRFQRPFCNMFGKAHFSAGKETFPLPSLSVTGQSTRYTCWGQVAPKQPWGKVLVMQYLHLASTKQLKNWIKHFLATHLGSSQLCWHVTPLLNHWVIYLWLQMAFTSSSLKQHPIPSPNPGPRGGMHSFWPERLSFKLNTISPKGSEGFSVAPLDPWKQPSSTPAREALPSCSSTLQRTRIGK